MSMSEAQKLLLLSYMEQSPELCNNRSFMAGETKQQRKAKWDAIAACLNAIGGIQKDATGWQLIWKSWRYRVRKNMRGNICNIGGTGGGAGTAVNATTEPGEEGGTRVVDVAANLQGLDARVMALVGWDTLGGIAGSHNVAPQGTVTLTDVVVVSAQAPAEEPAEIEDPVRQEESASAEAPTMAPEPAGSSGLVQPRPNSQPGTRVQRRRRRRVPINIAQQILAAQRTLVDRIDRLTEAMTPISEYYRLKLERMRQQNVP
ncbi:uncharacterized protein LOC135366932 [Ornithodoros turicata]|uniref:uncharacterized protein LOC135366932 n=1 Tax=Ornithodoros turicata TaxID=34597 RepID=UPI00313902BD